MKTHFIIAGCLGLVMWGLATQSKQPSQVMQQWSASPKYGFIENKEQIIDQNNQPNPDVKYLFPGNGLYVQLRQQGWSYEVINAEKKQPKISEATGLRENYDPFDRHREPEEVTYHTHRIDVQLKGSNPNAALIPCDPSHDYINYYTTGTSEEGVTNVYHYKRIVYKDIYPNIDIEFMVTAERGIKYNFIVHPGGNYRDIKMKYEGADGIGICEAANDGGISINGLTITTAHGELREETPHSYQIVNGVEHKINVQYKLLANGLIGMKPIGRLVASEPLVIDPVLIWGTYYGGTETEYGKDITTDHQGNIFVTGEAYSATAIATTGAHQEIFSGNPNDAFIVKLDSYGNRLWGTYYGGDISDSGWDIDIDRNGNLLVIGWTASTTNIGTTGAHQVISGGSYDAFVAKFNGGGNRLWATYYGGNSFDYGMSVCVDVYGNVFALGHSYSDNNIATVGAHQATRGGGGDAFVVKLTSTGARLWATYYGGAGDELSYDLALDSSGNILITGSTESLDSIATPGAHQTSSGGGGNDDAFVAKFDSNGNSLWGTYYGGTNRDAGFSVATDISGNVIVAGYAGSTTNIATNGSHQTLYEGDTDGLIVKFDGNGTRLWGTYYGGVGHDIINDVTTDKDGSILVTGNTASLVDIATAGTYQPNHGGAGSEDAFIVKFTDSGNRLWGTYYGGTDTDQGQSITIDRDENILITGRTRSYSRIAGAGAHQSIFGGSDDAFIAKLSGDSPPSLVVGKIFEDTNRNCTFDSVDLNHRYFLVKAEPGPHYGLSDSAGNYSIFISDTGSYSVTVATQDSLWQFPCITFYNVQLTSAPDTVTEIDFPMKAILHCPRLTIDITIPRLRRCLNNTYAVWYRNTGSLQAPNSYVEIDFGNYLQPQNSTIPWSAVTGNVYTFPIGNLNINQLGSFNVTALLDCTAPLGSTQCVTAHIYPDSSCVPLPAGWDNSEVKVTGGCDNDSLVCFRIINGSQSAMAGTSQWRLFVNDTLVTQGAYQLAGQDSLIQCYPANGKTYRLEADQRLGHPGNSHPQAIVEACGSPNNFGFVNTVAQDDEDLFVETFCMTVTGSYDPNDKQVFPTGVTSNKYIKPEDELEYLIRFQNTGNDTAFKVVIRDTIQTDVIDIATLTSGASSHDYTFNIYGHGIAEWTFENILLPDSNVNEPESHGFVKFKAKLLPNITPGTLVTNSADIYFNFNAPVITNEVWNTVFDTVLRAPVIISGTVLTESNTPVAGVTVKLAGSTTDSVVTATDGSYVFDVEPGGSYTITPSKNNDAIPSNGLTTYDILTMRKHLLSIGALPSPYKIISAAEVNAAADTSVTTQDIVLIRSLILGNTTSFPGSRLWQFVSSDFLFNHTEHPFPFNKTRTYTNLITPQLNQNFIGIKLGDVNDSWQE